MLCRAVYNRVNSYILDALLKAVFLMLLDLKRIAQVYLVAGE